MYTHDISISLYAVAIRTWQWQEAHDEAGSKVSGLIEARLPAPLRLLGRNYNLAQLVKEMRRCRRKSNFFGDKVLDNCKTWSARGRIPRYWATKKFEDVQMMLRRVHEEVDASLLASM
jgi:hypothetical protein